ncbi:MAG: M48 family metallopeptidase [Candidatus Saccharicenans sp.]
MNNIRLKIIRSRRRTVGLEITQAGELLVRAPENLSKAQLEVILQKHQRWIARKIALVSQRTKVVSRRYQPGEKFLYLGKEYPLLLRPHGQMSLSFDGQAFWLAENSQTKVKSLFEKLYKKLARHYLSSRLKTLSKSYGLNYKKFRLSSARTRFGSCSLRGTISLSWRLIMAPPEIIDYVIIHELAHTKENNHSKNFWKLVAYFVPDYKEKRRWLRTNGFRLNL